MHINLLNTLFQLAKLSWNTIGQIYLNIHVNIYQWFLFANFIQLFSILINSCHFILIQVNIYAQFIQFHLMRAYDLTNNGNLDGVNVTVELNGQIIANEFTAGDWTKLHGMPDGETVTLTSILDGYHPNIQTILVDINNHNLLVGMSLDVIF
jgi:hypothetical protein